MGNCLNFVTYRCNYATQQNLLPKLPPNRRRWAQSLGKYICLLKRNYSKEEDLTNLTKDGVDHSGSLDVSLYLGFVMDITRQENFAYIAKYLIWEIWKKTKIPNDIVWKYLHGKLNYAFLLRPFVFGNKLKGSTTIIL